MKKQWNARLSQDTILGIKMVQKEHGFRSEAAAVEWLVANRQTPVLAKESPFSLSPAAAEVDRRVLDGVAPRGSFSLAQLRELVADKPDPDCDLSDTPCAPFDLSIEGEPHRVAPLGKGLALFYVGPDGLRQIRPVSQTEMETLWHKRTK